MRVADREHPVGARLGRAGQHAGQLVPAPPGRAEHVVRVDHFDHPLQRPHDLGPSRQVRGQLPDQAGQRPDILPELPHGHVEQADIDRAQPVERRRAGGQRVAQRGRAELPAGANVGVGCGLEVDVDRRARAVRQRDVATPRLDAAEHAAVWRVGHALGLEPGLAGREAEVDYQLGPGVRLGPVRRHRTRDVEPDRAPRRPPRRADRERAEPLADRLGERHRFAGRGPGPDVHRSSVPVGGRGEALPDEPRHPAQHQLRVVVHRLIMLRLTERAADRRAGAVASAAFHDVAEQHREQAAEPLTGTESGSVRSSAVQSRMGVPDAALLALLGSRDESLRTAEDLLDADVHVRGNEITLTGPPADVAFAERVFTELITLAERGQQVSVDAVRRTVEMLGDDEAEDRARIGESPAEVLSLDILSRRGKTIRPKTLNQKRYVDAIDAHTIVFGIGPAGTGKTYLGMAKAVQALQAKLVTRIILTRPAVEAGERLGYLPGTLYEKIDPYLRPLYDALHDMIDPESIPKLMAAGTIEVAPLAYMRGRTLNDAFIILDEAQNTTPEQMKMFLTRLGFGSKIVVTGDVTQIDLPGGTRSGLNVVRDILSDVDDVHFALLSSADVVRHRLVADIVDAYGRWDAANERPNLRAAAPRNGPPPDRRSRRR